MSFGKEQYIHDLSVDAIAELLRYGAWQSQNQQVSSALTNNNDLTEPDIVQLQSDENTDGVNAFVDIQFDKNVKTIVDVGGGRFDNNKQYLKREKNIHLLIWDPYNRSTDHNLQIQQQVMRQRVDAATSMSVLNVIAEVSVRLAHIVTLLDALRLNGKAYFKIWPGERLLKSSYLSVVNQLSYQSNAHACRFFREIEMVFGIGNVEVHSSIPNLIVAVKRSGVNLDPQHIKHIQNRVKMDLIPINRIREKSVARIYASENIKSLFSRNLSLFKFMIHSTLEKNRHHDELVQHEYDKKYGLRMK